MCVDALRRRTYVHHARAVVSQHLQPTPQHIFTTLWSQSDSKIEKRQKENINVNLNIHLFGDGILDLKFIRVGSVTSQLHLAPTKRSHADTLNDFLALG